MNRFIKQIACVLAFTLLGYAQIKNVTFKDLEGKSWDLYAELAKGKSVLVHATGSG